MISVVRMYLQLNVLPDVSIMEVLLTPLPPEASMQPSDLSIDVSSPVMGPSTALDTIISVLKNEDNRYQAEIRRLELLIARGTSGMAGYVVSPSLFFTVS